MLLSRARSFLFVPADRLDRLPKALASPAHVIVADLEDGVGPASKSDARAALGEAYGRLNTTHRTRIAVRINAAGTPWHDDDVALLRLLARAGLAAAMVPKAESVSRLRDLWDTAAVPLLPIIESAEGMAALELIARTPGVCRLAFGHLDFQADLSMHCGPEERELDSIRLAIVLASRRAGLSAPLDGVTTDLHDDSRLQADALRARRFGFGGKLCIHPRQVVVVNDAMAPSAEEREWASRVLAAAESESGNGAFSFEGAMVDAPVLQRANRVLQESSPETPSGNQ